jgi:tetratricopeptide (TPR) repeat protein
MMLRLVLSLLLVAPTVFAAGKGADALLDSLGGAEPVTNTNSAAPKAAPVEQAMPVLGQISAADMTDPFQVQFFSQLQVERDLPYEARLWAQKVLTKDYQGAAHLWSAIQKSLPGKFEPAARTAYLYCLWKLDLPQTFFNEWVDSLSRRSFLDSSLSLALEATITGSFDNWLLAKAPTISSEQIRVLSKIEPSRGKHFASLQAWSVLRSGEKAAPTLALLQADHPLKAPVARTVALALARKGDLRGAGAVLKQHLEPALDKQKDVKGLSKHYMEIARLLYQAGSLDGAADFYQRIPDGSEDFLKAREELAWVWLRKGDTARLRGELKTLRSGLFTDHFSPDVYVVRSISHLKLCFYSDVEKELNDFVNTNKVWASKIETALKAEDPENDEPDFFTEIYSRAAAARAAEAELLSALATQSITATLPAVGPQQHWERAKVKALAAAESAKKSSAEEVRRHWKNRKTILTEAIRKMQFVKVELFSQVRTLSRASTPAGTPSGAVSAVERDTASRLGAQTQAALKTASEGEMVFPFDGVIWPDELFKLTSVAQSRCQEKVRR